MVKNITAQNQFINFWIGGNVVDFIRKLLFFFRVSDEEWEQYIQPNMRGEVICRECYDFIKSVIDNHG